MGYGENGLTMFCQVNLVTVNYEFLEMSCPFPDNTVSYVSAFSM